MTIPFRPQGYPAISLPSLTVTSAAPSAVVAGPFSTAPVSALKALPWQAQVRVVPLTESQTQPWWVQTALKAL